VKARVKTDDPRSVCVRPCDFDGVLGGFRASADKKRFVGLPRLLWHKRIQFLGEQDIRFVCHHLKAGVREILELRFDRRLNFRVRMSDIQDTNATSEINKLAPFDIPKFRTLGSSGKKRG
jgi:hypothetical protein